MINLKRNYINAALARSLIRSQFPEWKGLNVREVEGCGWDNKTFHLGEYMSIRLPSSEEYSSQVGKEHFWLNKLAPLLPLSAPSPLALGEPDENYPWYWSVYEWIEGKTALTGGIVDLSQFATDLGNFLLCLQAIESKEGPGAGKHNFYRGGNLKVYELETKQAISGLSSEIDVLKAERIWNKAISSSWSKKTLWIHGDIAPGNFLAKEGRLSAVIDFGSLGIGDPACDLAIAWTFFKKESREAFYRSLPFDEATWMRGRAWALWKTLIDCNESKKENRQIKEESKEIINEILSGE
ncbi:Uncharacterized protein AB751O23_AX_00040 [Chlamydiales bacterium SCGC AB-751-O23]|jgi:aminoglycoside phosphotransferase (APT) family kinase protein|nr:Uncharacterized protein AB751O23_AX_00040 [Chlamydiales bacterium SCGC AB-751-O23]